MTHANPQQKTGRWGFRKGLEGMSNVFADISKAVRVRVDGAKKEIIY